jgi:hypothetical protein
MGDTNFDVHLYELLIGHKIIAIYFKRGSKRGSNPEYFAYLKGI